MTISTMPQAEPDQYGQVHPKETPCLIESKLKEMEEKVTKISPQDAYQQALKKCPEEITTDFKVMFLRCEVFNTDLAARRFVQYWEKRLDLFGPDKAFLPLTQDQALRDDVKTLEMDCACVVDGSYDPEGRGILFLDPSKQEVGKFSRESMTRTIWYMIHTLLESPSTQKVGFVGVLYTKHCKMSHFDAHLAEMLMSSIKGCLPIRIGAVHICHPPSFFRLVFPIIKYLMGSRLRKRIRVHGGSEKHVLENLAEYGLTRDKLPSDLGGKLVLDCPGWLEERRLKGK